MLNVSVKVPYVCPVFDTWFEYNKLLLLFLIACALYALYIYRGMFGLCVLCISMDSLGFLFGKCHFCRIQLCVIGVLLRFVLCFVLEMLFLFVFL
jgi:hypothetical protein